MNTYSIYHLSTGVFLPERFACSLACVLDQLPIYPDCSFIVGEYDNLSQRVDLETGDVIDYIPPPPSPRHVWDAATKRWVYAPGAAEALYHAQQDALERINLRCSFGLSAIRSGTPPDEVTSWSKQESEARAWTADNAAATPLLSAIAEARGIPFAYLVGKVIEKADLFAAYSGQLIGARQQAEDRINAATTPDAVGQILSEIFPPTTL